MITEYYQYLFSNHLFMERKYKLIKKIMVQKIQIHPVTYLAYVGGAKMLIDDFTNKVIDEGIKKEKNLGEIFQVLKLEFPDSEDTELIILIMKVMKKLSLSGFIKISA